MALAPQPSRLSSTAAATHTTARLHLQKFVASDPPPVPIAGSHWYGVILIDARVCVGCMFLPPRVQFYG